MALQQLWIEPVGGIIVARIRGELTEALLRECQDRVVALARDTQYNRVLYDALELEAPGLDLVIMQQKLVESELESVNLRRAFLVQNTRIAYLARLGFGEGDHRVFYNDLAGALSWLQQPASGGVGE